MKEVAEVDLGIFIKEIEMYINQQKGIYMQQFFFL